MAPKHLVLVACALCISFRGFAQASEGAQVSADSEQIEENVIITYNLPEPFNNDSLPVKQSGDNCWPLIGCYATIPPLDPPISPQKLDPVFYLSQRDHHELEIRYQETEVCWQNASVCHTYPYDLNLIESSEFNSSLRTIVLVSGWLSGEIVPYLDDTRDAWRALEPCNVIRVSWPGGSQTLDYAQAASNTKTIARQITVLLYYLAQMKGGHSLKDEKFAERLVLVGHSLGAHIVAFVGKDLAGQAGSVAALDPANPLFRDSKPEFRLVRTDAQLVQVIHSDGGWFGLKDPTGHLDFFANDGSHQPGCSRASLFCNHLRAPSYYLTSLRHELKLRETLGHSPTGSSTYHSHHRLFAYRSANYGQFRNGSALLSGCPRAVSRNSAKDSDLTRCLVPMDFVTDPKRLRQELEHTYALNLDEPQQPSLFFYTQRMEPFLNNHYLLRLIVSKQHSFIKKSCLLEFHVDLGYNEMNYYIEDYELISKDDHYEIIAPFLSTNLSSSVQLAELDSNDFYVKDVETLKRRLVSLLPSSIKIKGSHLDSRNHTGRKQNRTATEDNLFGCKLKFSKVLVQPLNELGRFVSASYGTKKRDLPDVEFIGRKGGRETTGTRNTCSIFGMTKLHLDTVFIGGEVPKPNSHHSGDSIHILELNPSSDRLMAAHMTVMILIAAAAIGLIFLLIAASMRRAERALSTVSRMVIE